MKYFRIVGFIKDFRGQEKQVFESWGNCNLSIETIQQLAHIYNIKYNYNWYMEFKEEN